MSEELPLSGGHTTPEVMRIGSTVHRTPGPNSEFVAELLRHLERHGASVAPRYLGRDEHGRDVLEYIPGQTTDHPSQRDEAAYGQCGRLLRRLHDATAGHPLAQKSECVIHTDPGPYNVIFQDGLPVTLIDWDEARPGNRIWDLGYAAWTWCVTSAGRIPVQDQADRVMKLRAGYGKVGGEQLLSQIVECQTFIADNARAQLGRSGQSDAFYDHHRAAIAWADADRRWFQEHLEIFRDAL
jgi:aminoglycoside phosphotransferase (APT) family kinase protein